MSNAIFDLPLLYNEPVLKYKPGSPEKSSLLETIGKIKSEQWDIPMIIGGKEVRTRAKEVIHPPHAIHEVLGTYSKGTARHVRDAIQAALAAKAGWENMAWHDRAAIFLKAAELLAGPYRNRMNAATMLGQSKNVYQAEIDCIAELADFYRFNASYLNDIYGVQPDSNVGIWNRLEYRALEGFVFAITL